MAYILNPKRSISEVILPSQVMNAFRLGLVQNRQEVLRNDTTAVEVIVKQTGNKHKKKTNAANTSFDNDKIIKFADDIESFKTQLNEANKNIRNTKKSYEIIMFQMKKQLETAYQRELKMQAKNIGLQLEKEKLKTMLESKSNLIGKLRKELLSLRRILKIVMKGIRCAPKVPQIVLNKSDLEYTEFEQELTKDTYLSNYFDNDGVTFDSIFSSKI